MEQENQETAEEPAQSPQVEIVTKKTKDQRKVAAGRVGAAARKVKEEEQFLERLRGAKEPLRPPHGRRHVCQYSSKGSGSGFPAGTL